MFEDILVILTAIYGICVAIYIFIEVLKMIGAV